MRTRYTKLFKEWADSFEPECYGYTLNDWENGNIDLFDEWVTANYGNSGTARYLRENREEVTAAVRLRL